MAILFIGKLIGISIFVDITISNDGDDERILYV